MDQRRIWQRIAEEFGPATADDYAAFAAARSPGLRRMKQELARRRVTARLPATAPCVLDVSYTVTPQPPRP